MVQVSFHHQFIGCKSVHGIIWRASSQFSAHITCLQLSSLQPIRWLQVSFLHQLEGCNSVLCTNQRVYIMFSPMKWLQIISLHQLKSLPNNSFAEFLPGCSWKPGHCTKPATTSQHCTSRYTGVSNLEEEKNFNTLVHMYIFSSKDQTNQ